MRLVSVYTEPEAVDVLYRLMEERPRESWITHEGLPTREEHLQFVRSIPFLCWYLIEEGGYIGAIECNDRNELAISVLKEFQRKGYGTRALKLFFSLHKPLPAIPAIRNGHWLANIAHGNDYSKIFFSRLGFSPLQTTYVL